MESRGDRDQKDASGEAHPARGQGPTPARSNASRAWAWAVTWIVLATLLVGAALYVFTSLLKVPGQVARGGKELVQGLSTVAEAFRTGTVTTRFLSHATEVTGSNRLQFATLDQVEIFERTDEATVLWGQLALPDLVVEARAPVQYTYYLDLQGAWRFVLEDERIYVLAPPIRFNKPAVDASEIQYTVREGSLLRNEEEAMARLKSGITWMSVARARENIGLVRELARRETRRFVEAWLKPSFGDGDHYVVEVVFADEEAPAALPADAVEGPTVTVE